METEATNSGLLDRRARWGSACWKEHDRRSGGASWDKRLVTDGVCCCCQAGESRSLSRRATTASGSMNNNNNNFISSLAFRIFGLCDRDVTLVSLSGFCLFDFFSQLAKACPLLLFLVLIFLHNSLFPLIISYLPPCLRFLKPLHRI